MQITNNSNGPRVVNTTLGPAVIEAGAKLTANVYAREQDKIEATGWFNIVGNYSANPLVYESAFTASLPYIDPTLKQFGAKGDGVTDDTAAILAASNAGTVLLAPGQVYKVTGGTHVTRVVNNGGLLKCEAGVVTYDAVIGDPAVVCFTGEGAFRNRSNTYSIGHYVGDTYNKKWDFLRRALIANERKVIVMPAMAPTDPAYWAPGVAKTDAAIKIGDPENNAVYVRYTAFAATAQGQEAVIEFSGKESGASSALKTEDVSWPFGIDIDCLSVAKFGVLSHGGARMHFRGKSRIMRPRLDGVCTIMDEAGVLDAAQPEFDWLECSRFGRNAVSYYGSSTRAVHRMKIGTLISNGARAVWCTATVSGGNLQSLSINALGPNGAAQDLTGHFAGEVLRVVSKTGSGVGAQVTLGAGNVNSSGQITTLPALSGILTGYTDQEIVYLTAADAYVKFSGSTRECIIGELYDYQDDTANLCSPWDHNVIVDATADGASQKLEVGSIKSRLGRRPLLCTRDSSGSTAARHSLKLGDFAINSATYNGAAYLQLLYLQGGSAAVSDKPADQTTNLAQIDSSTTNFSFQGFDRERVVGNGSGVTFDGQRMYYSTGLADDAVGNIRYRPPVNTFSMATVEIHTRDNASLASYHAIYQLAENTSGGWQAVGTPNAIFEPLANQGIAAGATGGTDGKIAFSYDINTGNFFIKNRIGNAARIKVVIR